MSRSENARSARSSATAHDQVDNEKRKLSATFLNNIAVAVIATGLVAPFFTVLYGLTNLTLEQVRFFGLAAPGWVLMGGLLHLIARAMLGGLKP